jgi:hypothetical protein
MAEYAITQGSQYVAVFGEITPYRSREREWLKRSE